MAYPAPPGEQPRRRARDHPVVVAMSTRNQPTGWTRFYPEARRRQTPVDATATCPVSPALLEKVVTAAVACEFISPGLVADSFARELTTARELIEWLADQQVISASEVAPRGGRAVFPTRQELSGVLKALASAVHSRTAA